MAKKYRIEEIDIAKGIGIILVISGHLCENGPIRNFIYSFHMPLFFMLSGLVYNVDKAKSLKIAQIKNLTAKYIEWSVIYLAFDFVIRYGIEGSRTKCELWNEIIMTISFYGISVLWFLSALIIGLIIVLLVGKRNNMFVWCVLGGTAYFISAICSDIALELPFKGGVVFFAIVRGVVAFSWLSLGIGFQRALLNRNHEYNASIFKMVLLWIIIYIISNKAEPIEYSGLQMGNPLISFVLGVIGCIATLYLAKYVSKVETLKKFLMYFGANSLFIMATHQYLHINKVVEIGAGFFAKSVEVRTVIEILSLCVIEYALCLYKQWFDRHYTNIGHRVLIGVKKRYLYVLESIQTTNEKDR